MYDYALSALCNVMKNYSVSSLAQYLTFLWKVSLLALDPRDGAVSSAHETAWGRTNISSFSSAIRLSSPSFLILPLNCYSTALQPWGFCSVLISWDASCQPAPSVACPWVWQVLKPRVTQDCWLPEPGNCSGSGVLKAEPNEKPLFSLP